LDELEANANIKLRNSRGRVIEKSTRRGDNFESISTELDPGKYYLQVYRHGRGQDTEYELSFDVTQTQPDIAGNNRRRAYNIGLLNGSEIFNEFVGENDPEDFYKFRLNETADVEVVLSELSEDADLQLLDSRGQLLQSFPENGTTPELIFGRLSRGTYYVNISSYFGANTDYQLSLFNWGV
ncbi:MAG: PPC domain-containing protein, partial [Trichodesmium sp.]